ncbi:hypothetical protein AB0873_15080 [Micromonospora sp. NPDC047707]|uniref:helix-turn-helix transcriptional regulator n=1 Tax=Micromonospora sp. NPDC047707 TaxID=3154498 RepID=UPI003452DF23
MKWHAEAELVGQVTQEQLITVAQLASVTRYNEEARILTVQRTVDADDYAAALDAARAWVGEVAAVTGEPRLVTVESEESRVRGLDLLGSAEVAARLGVSTARVRQLEQRPDFPEPVLTLAGGRIYRASDIDAFDREWSRIPGRPRKAAPPEA